MLAKASDWQSTDNAHTKQAHTKQAHTHTPYLAARALRGHVSDGLLVFLQHLRQRDITAFTGNIKY